MSHNQARTFPAHGFSNMSATTLPRQQVMNQPFQPGGPSPTLSHPSGSSTVSPSSTPRSSNSTTINHSLNGPSSSNSGPNVSAPATQETMYCDSCQTFRHIAFFNERDFKYGICTLCQNREVQKRKQQLERYELYGEQQRKQARYQLQYATAPQLPPSHPIQSQIHSPISLVHTPASSPQIKQSSPSIVSSLSSQINPTKPLFSSPMRNQTQMQPNLHQQMIQALPTQDIQSTTSNTTSSSSSSPAAAAAAVSTSSVGASVVNVPHQTLPLPPPPQVVSPQKQENSITMTTSISRTSQHMDRQSQEVITFETFVSLLERETEFDRKQYHLDISPLMETMGEGAGFTQLGRGICEHVLKGTKFNFSLKDRRRSTKSPDTLSTLRYYCSQRADTAKPRKAEHPKAQNRYDCAGALTIIIDLIKKMAHVTVIHKHSHPPFVSQHHHQKQQAHTQLTRARQQQQQQQQQQNSSQHLPLQPSASQVQQQQHQQHQQQQLKLMKQREAKQIDKQFEILRQKVTDFGKLLESQQQYCNEEFINAATEAFSEANELLIACQAADSDMNSRPNKYTLHYNKKEDNLV